MKSLDLNKIERETYAYIVKKFILDNEGDKPRIILLGFSDVGDQVCQQFQQTKVQIIEPERTGRLKEASSIRKSEQPCMILIRSKKNLGKFASLVTAFKILDEVFSSRTSAVDTSARDVHDLCSMSIWLVNKNVIRDICSFIGAKLSISFQPDCDGIAIILNELRRIAMQRPSFIEWLHPRRISRGLVYAIHRKRTSGATTVAFFLRSIGIEPKRKLEDVPLFSMDIKREENLKELRDTLLEYPKILRMYHACSIPRQRTNLANLCINHFRNVLYTLANSEWSSKSISKWIKALDEFERVTIVGTKKRRRKKKYRPISRGVRIHERSSVSGLPVRIRLPLEIDQENGGRNLLKELYDGELTTMLEEYSKVLEPEHVFFRLEPVDLENGDSKLNIELSIVDQNGDILLDPFIEGSKSPTRKINALLTEVRRELRRLTL